MAQNSAISWTDDTFNPWIGCTRVSPACDGCYAAALMGGEAHRFHRADWGGPGKGDGTRARTSPSTWAEPLKWNRAQAAKIKVANDNGTAAPLPRFVFCASLADVFDNHEDLKAWRKELFALIRATPHLTWLLLTKRPGNIVKLFLESQAGQSDPGSPAPTMDEALASWPANAAIGCTVVNQEEADRDIPRLLMAKLKLNPAFAFVSMEPLLGRVDLTRLSTIHFRGAELLNALTGELLDVFGHPTGGILPALDWVITGGETDQGDHKARPAAPAIYQFLREQCARFGVAFHFKQWGEWQPYMEQVPANTNAEAARFDDGSVVWRLGKKVDPGTLDGVIHHARPMPRAA